jgi:hypothetical protein
MRQPFQNYVPYRVTGRHADRHAGMQCMQAGSICRRAVYAGRQLVNTGMQTDGQTDRENKNIHSRICEN